MNWQCPNNWHGYCYQRDRSPVLGATLAGWPIAMMSCWRARRIHLRN